MSADEIQRAFEALQSGFRDTLGRHLETVAQEHDAALARARRDAAAEAEQAVAAQLEAVRADSAQQLEAELAAVKEEAERRLVAETARARVEAEQASAERAAIEREELEHALTAERERAEARVREVQDHATREMESERARAREAIEAERGRVEAAEARAEAAEARAAIADARGGGREAQAVDAGRILAAVQAIGGEHSLTGVFERLVEHAAASASRATVLVVNGDHLQGLRAAGFDGTDPSRLDLRMDAAGALADVVRTGTARAVSDTAALALPNGRAGFAAPLLVGGHVVAVLYADPDGAEPSTSAASWTETIELLAQHASSALGLVTATRTLQAFGGPAAGSAEADDQSARRYARLLVSEIKLYNESAVRVGREKRDLLARLASEIDRARRLYEERIPPAVGARASYFQQELVQTLADGDPALLGQT